MLNIPQEKLTAIKNFAHQYIFKLLCQQDIPFILAHLDPQLIGIGAAEHNYYDTPQTAKDFILSLEGQIPACELLNEEWTILPLAQGLYLAQGRHYLTSDEDQQLLVQTHQQATIVIRDLGSDFSYVYINLSHPYQELQGTENFPFQVGSQTYKYMEAELNKAKEQLQQKQQQMEVVLHSVNGGVKSSNDDDIPILMPISAKSCLVCLVILWKNSKNLPATTLWEWSIHRICPGLWLTATNVLRTEILLTRQNTACPVKTAA